ncbi:MAG: DUF4859 domain-containing protein, partial [Muribaculaceae bacterium]|nr:DUF4859 domain-containing protein [Muribaculaceae bacterium]
ISKWYRLAMMSVVAAGMTGLTASCSDDDMSKTEADYDPRYQGSITAEADYEVSADAQTLTVPFNCDMAWTAQVLDDQGEACTWATVAPAAGEEGDNEVVVTLQANEDMINPRTAQLQIISEKSKTVTITIEQGYRIVMLDPTTIADYDRYTIPGEWNPHFENGPEYMLRQDSYYSWHRMKQSEHFFVFWSPEFGDDPNAESVTPSMRVDIDDLLAKAEHFFDTNVNKLGMATLGEGKSMLDNYKMQIYLIYQDEWLATGSGYDDKIGALWVNPSTCQPVGSTIAHEIGHSFQYQTYADRVQCQGASNDYTSGWRYGFYGPDGSGNGGCGYWEQCAQWQAQRDYPEEQINSYHFQVWLDNCHRHFHHEWMRYASYYLQTYWTNLRGIEAYGRLWKESVAPEDAIMTYTRLYNNSDYAVTREELFEYAMKMATFDIDGVREYAEQFNALDRYDPQFVINVDDEYQISYGSCPGATGFNVIPLIVPANGGQVKVNFRGLGYGAPIAKADKSNIVDGDGNAVGKPSAYNAVGGAENMGWRYGFVALKGGQRTYSTVGKDLQGVLTFDVPAGTEYLYLVVQGSPEVYMSQGWDDDEVNDPQFPYVITFENTDIANYQPPVEAEYEVVGGELIGKLTLSVAATNGDWVFSTYDINEPAVQQFFGLSEEELAGVIVEPLVGVQQIPTDGKIVVLNENNAGEIGDMPTANVGYWLDATATPVSWGNGQIVYYEMSGSVIQYGKLGSDAGEAGDVIELCPVFVYTKNGETKTMKMKTTYRFK